MQLVARFVLSLSLVAGSLMTAGNAYAGSTTGLVITGGDNQAVSTGNAFPIPLSVRLTDSSGDAIENETIEFAVQFNGGAGAELAPTSVQTDAGGNARTTAIAGAVAGSYSVRASIGGGQKRRNAALGGTPPVDFSLTNLGGTPAAATALPALSTTALILLALLLGFVGWRARGMLRQHH